MEITCRNDAYLAKATLKSKLVHFERKLYDFKEISEVELFVFLVNQKCKFAYDPTFGAIIMIIKGLIKGKIDLEDMNQIGEPLECNFQYVKIKRRSSKKKQPYPQRYHGRVYIFDYEIVIVSETETAPKTIESAGVHLSEKHEHRFIRLKKREFNPLVYFSK